MRTVLLLSAVLALAPSVSRAGEAGNDAQLARLATGSEQDRIRAAALLGTPGADGKAMSALAEAAASGSAVVRVAAIRALARTQKAEAVAPVADQLGADDAVVADEAKDALEALASPKTAAELVQAFETRPQVRAKLVSALAASKDAKAHGRLGDALADADAGVRASADRTLRLASREVQYAALAHCLAQLAGPEKLPCVALAGELKEKRFVAVLAPVATDPFGASEVREAARTALLAMKDELDAPKLAETARQAKSADDRANALALLSLVHDERGYVALTKGLDDAEEAVRARAAFCLGEFGDARAVKPLAKALDDGKNARIRKVVQGALDRLTQAR